MGSVRRYNKSIGLSAQHFESFRIYRSGHSFGSRRRCKIAQKANVPIVVCSLVNSRAILHNMFRKHTEVWLDVLDVVPAEELAGKTAIEVGERVHAVMEAGIVARETEQGLRA